MTTRLWAARAGAAERGVHTRHLRRVAGVPGTRLGLVGWPPTPRERALLRWRPWWQWQLLDCAVDAQLRAPLPWRQATVAALVRGIRLRGGGDNGGGDNGGGDNGGGDNGGGDNGGGEDGGAGGWSDLALHRAHRHAGLPQRAAARTPVHGPAAILLAGRGEVDLARALLDERLLDADTGLLRDARHPVRELGALIGGCVAMLAVTGAPEWSGRAERAVCAADEHLTTTGVLGRHGARGADALDTAILARHLAQAGTALPAGVSRDTARRLVLRSAEAAWDNRGIAVGGPVFGAQWTVPAHTPQPGRAERELATQLAGWMLLEAAAVLELPD